MSTASIVTVRRRNRFQTTALARRTAPMQMSPLGGSFVRSMVKPLEAMVSVARTARLPALFDRSSQQSSATNWIEAPVAPPVVEASYLADPPQPHTKRSSLLTFFD